MRIMWLPLKGGEPTGGAGSRVGLISSPHIDRGGIEVRIMPGEILLEAREERERIKEGVFQEDTGVNNIPF